MDLYKQSHYNLVELKELIRNPKTRIITDTARKNSYAIGLVDEEEIVEQVLNLKTTDIFKTMTAYYDNTLWQDVYKPTINGVAVYIKLQKNKKGDGVVIQFKLADEDFYE